MAEEKQVPEQEAKELHWYQRFLDNPWILLLLGFLIPFLSYTVWGILEILSLKEAKLP